MKGVKFRSVSSTHIYPVSGMIIFFLLESSCTVNWLDILSRKGLHIAAGSAQARGRIESIETCTVDVSVLRIVLLGVKAWISSPALLLYF